MAILEEPIKGVPLVKNYINGEWVESKGTIQTLSIQLQARSSPRCRFRPGKRWTPSRRLKRRSLPGGRLRR